MGAVLCSGTAGDYLLCFMDLESCVHALDLSPYRRWCRGVQVWLRELNGCVDNLPDCSNWRGAMRAIASCVEGWWDQICRQGPIDHAINEMLARSRWNALEAIPEVWIVLRRQWQTDAREVMQLRCRCPQELTSLVESF